MTDLPRAVHLLNAAPVSAIAYRAGRRLFDLAGAHDLTLPQQQVCDLCGCDSWSGARKLLSQLKRHSILTWTTRGDTVTLAFIADTAPDRGNDRAASGQQSPAPRQIGAANAPDRGNERAGSGQQSRQIGAETPPPRQIGATSAPDRGNERAGSGQPPHTHARTRPIGWLVDQHPTDAEGEQPTNHPQPSRQIGAVDTAPEPGHPSPVPGPVPAEVQAAYVKRFGVRPGTPEHARAYAMLIDPDVAIRPHVADELAARGPDEIERQIADWLTRRQTEPTLGTGLLVKSIRDRWPVQPVPAPFKRTAWYRRHHPDYDPDQEQTDQRRTEYVPDEYADLIIS